MTKKVTKTQYKEALGVVKQYAKQETKVVAKKTKKYAESTFSKFKTMLKK